MMTRKRSHDKGPAPIPKTPKLLRLTGDTVRRLAAAAAKAGMSEASLYRSRSQRPIRKGRHWLINTAAARATNRSGRGSTLALGVSGQRTPNQNASWASNLRRLSSWKTPQRASGRGPKVKACAFLSDFIAKQSFSVDCHLRHLRGTLKIVFQLKLLNARASPRLREPGNLRTFVRHP